MGSPKKVFVQTKILAFSPTKTIKNSCTLGKEAMMLGDDDVPQIAAPNAARQASIGLPGFAEQLKLGQDKAEEGELGADDEDQSAWLREHTHA